MKWRRKSFGGGLMMFCWVAANAMMLMGTRQRSVQAFSAAPPVTSIYHSWSRRDNVQKENVSRRRRGASIIRLHAEEQAKKKTIPPAPKSFSSNNNSNNSNNNIGMQKRLSQLRPVFLSHERDFFRQGARLESMDSYVLVSTLTASMSFGCLVGFKRQTAAAVAAVPLFQLAAMTKSNAAMLECMYRVLSPRVCPHFAVCTLPSSSA